MGAWLLLCAGFVLTIVASEVCRPSGKLQSSLGRVAIIHVLGLAATAATLVPAGGMGVVPILIFWSGGSLLSFGCRSHLESSILLRMVYMLRAHPLTREELNARYRTQFGEAQRMDELVRGGFLYASPPGAALTPTRRGSRIVKLVSRLR